MTLAVATAPSEPNDLDLSSFDAVFIDSRAALEEAKRRGLRPGVSVRTVSPALALDPRLAVESVDCHLPDNYRALLADVISQASLDIFQRCEGHTEFGPLGIVIAQRVVTQSVLVWSAMMVRPDDAERRLAVVRPRQVGQPYGVVVASGWERLLLAARKLRVIEVETPPTADPRRAEATFGFLDRQRHGRIDKLGYQLMSKVWRSAPVRSPRGTFLILRENYLLRETALALALRGYGLAWLTPPGPGSGEFVGTDRLLKFLGPALERIRPLVAPFLWQTLLSLLADDFAQAAKRYHSSLGHWRATLGEARNRGVRGVLTNVLIAPETAALHDACRERKIPLFAFQHGTSREISRNILHVEAIFEGNVADHYIAFSPAAAEVSMRTPFNRCLATPVGLPSAYSRAASYRRSRARSPTILFISSTLYAGHFNGMIAARGLSDVEMARNDVEVVSEVLSAIPYRVIFKPYPAVRYPDSDPVLEAAARAPNIEVFAGFEDVSLLLPDADLIVSARATSTIAWGATGNKPFVLIDHPRDTSILAAAKPAFERSFFVFDRDEPTFCERLRKFLSQPLAEIQAQWDEKRLAREATLLRYFGVNDGHAGRRAARLVQAASRST